MTYPWPVHPAAELFPLIDEAELIGLVEDIRDHGLIEPVWLWDDPDRGTVLLDGRNRVRACERAAVAVATRTYAGDDPVSFVVSENLKRRHLTSGQRDFLALGLEPMFAADAAKRMRAGKRDPVADLPQGVRAPLSRDKAAKTAGATGRGVAQAKRIARDAPDLAEKVKAGTIAIDRAERIIRDREAERRRIDEARAEAASQPEATRVDIRHGDFRDVLADLRDVDAIITDPPYPREFIPLLADLASWADKVLAPDGVLAVLMGQTYLPDVYRLLDGGRPYRWTACYLTPGAGYASMARRLQSNWKPLLIYGGGPRFVDVIRSGASDADAKNNHKWGQDYSAFHDVVERLTTRGQTVVDPFMGSGTTLLAAHALGRHAIGCDIDAAHVATARERVA